MKCSVCSRPIRPIVAFDIDGVLANYHAALARYAAEWLGTSSPQGVYTQAGPYGDWFMRTYGVDQATFRAIKLAFRQGGQKRFMPMFDYAPELVKTVRKYAEVWLTTTRPWERFDRVDPDTREWLRRNGIDFDFLMFDDQKMNALAERIDPDRVAAVVDDQEIILLEGADNFGMDKMILHQTPYNSAVIWPESNTGSTLREVESIIISKLEKWRHNHV